jgi:Family of unknown function (DUF6516)
MDAVLIIRDRRIFRDGCILEIVVWKVPEPVPPTVHGLKYRLFYGKPGKRIVGYDNERGKGDHRHVEGREEPYVFRSIESLLDDFEADVVKARGAAI